MAKVKGPASGGGHTHSGADKPPTASDRKMSIRHARDSVKFNLRHAKDHMKAAKKAKSRLQMVTRARVRAV